MLRVFLYAGDFRLLSSEHLGWDRASGSVDVCVDGRPGQVVPIVHKRGIQVFEHRTDRLCVQDHLLPRQRRRHHLRHERP